MEKKSFQTLKEREKCAGIKMLRFQFCCPFQDFNEPGWLLCLGLSPVCSEGTTEYVAKGEALVWSGWGLGREPRVVGTVVSPGCKCPSPFEAAGRLGWCCLGMKRDEKFCMAGCGEKQRQFALVCA